MSRLLRKRYQYLEPALTVDTLVIGGGVVVSFPPIDPTSHRLNRLTRRFTGSSYSGEIDKSLRGQDLFPR